MTRRKHKNSMKNVGWKRIEAINGVYYNFNNLFIPEKEFMQLISNSKVELMEEIGSMNEEELEGFLESCRTMTL